MTQQFKIGELSVEEQMIRALEKHLDMNRNDPAFEAIKDQVRKDLVAQLNKLHTKELYALRKDPLAMGTIIAFVIKAHSKELKLKSPHFHKQECSNLKRDCLRLLEKMKNENKELYNKLMPIFEKNAKGLNNENTQEFVQALKIMMTMHVLLEQQHHTELEEFAKNPEKTELREILPTSKPGQNTQSDDKELSESEKADVMLYGTTSQGTHQQASTATTGLDIVLTTVCETAMPFLFEKADEAVKEDNPTKSPWAIPTAPKPPWEQH